MTWSPPSCLIWALLLQDVLLASKEYTQGLGLREYSIIKGFIPLCPTRRNEEECLQGQGKYQDTPDTLNWGSVAPHSGYFDDPTRG